MKKAELLAPAGSYESFLGALCAGADAVYLGGDRFGARAYADNFTKEEICRAVRYAHIHGKKVYLTVNTLIREKELSMIYSYLEPLYHAGVDAVIIQDMGLFERVGEWFPGLDRHISTQMNVTGVRGAEYLKEKGAARIIPARELSLSELKKIKQEVNIPLETFIHGSMCYCYSGQCLFSSMLGGRSGNRGRCAQPCRLPFQVCAPGERDRSRGKNGEYPLSLRDMCTVNLIPELIGAGIDSFKIEGRMKSPEYVAGVTAVYRKYMDAYYENPRRSLTVSREDMARLKALYIRSEISEGYYRRHNGREMVTLKSSGYSGTDEKLSEEIRGQYLKGEEKLPAEGKIRLKKGEPARLTVSCGRLCVGVSGDCVQEAKSRPLSVEDVKKQLAKTGNTLLTFERLETDMDTDVFLPVKALNDLRRAACEKLETALERENGRSYPDRKNSVPYGGDGQEQRRGASVTCKNKKGMKALPPALHACVLTEEQLEAALAAGIGRIYISTDILAAQSGKIGDRKRGKNPCNSTGILKNRKKPDTEIYLALPYIIRMRDTAFLGALRRMLEEGLADGVLVRNLEELAWLKEISCPGDIVTDTGMYLYNSAAFSVFEKESAEQYLPLELNCHESEELLKAARGGRLSEMVYGRIPMMISAGCVAATMGDCKEISDHGGGKRVWMLTDRCRKSFPVYLNCRHCYNVIYNSLPLSLHSHMDRIKDSGLSCVRLDFTVEDRQETESILSFFQEILACTGKNVSVTPPFGEYTGGHFKRGVE